MCTNTHDLWPLFWMTVAIFITVYCLKRKKAFTPSTVPSWVESDAGFRTRLLHADSELKLEIETATGHDLDRIGKQLRLFRQAVY